MSDCEHQWINPEDDGNDVCLHCNVSREDWKSVQRHKALHALFDVFLMKWLQQPPLVRASAAVSTEETLERYIRANTERATREMKRMPRRSEVTARITLADVAISDLMAALANHADDEAVAKGIDADLPRSAQLSAVTELLIRQAKLHHPHKETRWVHPDGSELRIAAQAEIEKKVIEDAAEAETRWVHPDGSELRIAAQAEIEKKVIEDAAEAASVEIDKDVLGALGKALGTEEEE